MPESVPRKIGYLPGLDGLRAFAILGVMMTHDLPWTIFGYSNATWKGYGGWGVQLFFAISGVLICWRLLEDEAKQGELRLGAFYTRRIFRIQPAALTYLLLIAVLYATGAIPVSWLYWTSAILSFTNFLITASTPAGAPAFVGHFWTLSVEEHFYIILSLLFVVVRRRRAIWLGALVAAFYFGQEIAVAHGLYTPVFSERRSYWVLQLLLLPAFLSLCAHEHRVRTLIERYVRPWVVFAIFVMIVLTEFFQQGFVLAIRNWNINAFMGQNVALFFYGFGVLVLAIMLHPKSLATRFLELKPLRFLGRISYSLYLWHILFFVPVYLPEQIHSKTLLLLSTRPLKYIATAICALLSYYLVERPFIRFGHKIAPPSTEGHRDLQPAASVSN
jgi:peptidoglycan/LPS O-acetylase OafA/YrhL